MIRRAMPADAPAISRLLTQLEYPGTERFLPARLATMLADPAEILLVWADTASSSPSLRPLSSSLPPSSSPLPPSSSSLPPSSSPLPPLSSSLPPSSSSLPPSSSPPPSPSPSRDPKSSPILGFLSLHFIPQIALEGDFARISYFAIDETARSQGIGRQLEAEATRLAKERGCALLEVHCHARRTRAHGFYLRQGYEESPKYLIKRLS